MVLANQNTKLIGPDQGFLVSPLVLIWKPWEQGCYCSSHTSSSLFYLSCKLVSGREKLQKFELLQMEMIVRSNGICNLCCATDWIVLRCSWNTVLFGKRNENLSWRSEFKYRRFKTRKETWITPCWKRHNLGKMFSVCLSMMHVLSGLQKKTRNLFSIF